MSRRMRWGLVAAVCAVLAAPGLARIAAPTRAWDVEVLRAVPWTRVAPMLAVGLAAALAAVTIVGLLAARGRGGRAAAVRRLAARGSDVPAIARRTGLAQDAVRDLLSAPEATAAPGTFFRLPKPDRRGRAVQYPAANPRTAFGATR